LERPVAHLVRASGMLPESFVFGFLRFFKHSEPRPAFLLGRVSSAGWWYFFPVTFLLKTPVPLLVLLGIALATRRRHARPGRDELVLWLPVAIYAVVAVVRALNIGHRHLLPIYPFLFVAAGAAGDDDRGEARRPAGRERDQPAGGVPAAGGPAADGAAARAAADRQRGLLHPYL